MGLEFFFFSFTVLFLFFSFLSFLLSMNYKAMVRLSQCRNEGDHPLCKPLLLHKLTQNGYNKFKIACAQLSELNQVKFEIFAKEIQSKESRSMACASDRKDHLVKVGDDVATFGENGCNNNIKQLNSESTKCVFNDDRCTEEVIKETQLGLRSGPIHERNHEIGNLLNDANKEFKIESSTDPTIPLGFEDACLDKELLENSRQQEDVQYRQIQAEGEILANLKREKRKEGNKKERAAKNPLIIKERNNKRKDRKMRSKKGDKGKKG
ncbi:hypothetical protein PIB30_011453 [Stylosanthes scabra]|uniref:Uncharacterized protein n=1 Tax=Stylosanthes scabra TaxID=79078 RepID=A0ABU6R5N3_9FABA|nr:hypothetical protein [Stylosanthes scabra]